MASSESHSEAERARLLMRELRSKQNKRFLHGLPAFKLNDALPERMQSLLDTLDRSEREGASGGHAGATGAAYGGSQR